MDYIVNAENESGSSKVLSANRVTIKVSEGCKWITEFHTGQ